MNFQKCRELEGQNVEMFVTTTFIGETTYTKAGKAKQKCGFTDNTGEQQEVTIWQGKGQPIPKEWQGKGGLINISCKRNGQYINYGGFFNATAQAPTPSPAMRPVPKNNDDPDWDKIAEGKVRTCIVSAYLTGGKEPELDQVQYWVEYCMTGEAPIPPSSVPDFPVE